MTIVAGIICEYNPFHNGHLLQIHKLRHEKDADAIICVLSGHFMQRGEPALISKERRTHMALANGADLVLELPALYATRSAYWFALGGVCLLAYAGATHIAFGAETDDLAAFLSTAQRLARPDEAYTEGFRRYLSAGLSFSEAQAKALNYGEYANFVPVLPNDRLALSYLQVIAEKNLPLSPILIAREGGRYHDTDLAADTRKLSSATAIRQKLAQGVRAYRSPSLTDGQLQELGLSGHIPEKALPYLSGARLVFPADAADIELALLRRASRQTLLALPDMNEGLEYRIMDAASRSENLDAFYRRIKTKRYTMTRLQRMVTHLLIDYRQSHAAALSEGPPYLRILGASAEGRSLLHTMKKTSPVPLVTRTSQMKPVIRQSAHAANAWEIELRATAMYGLFSGADFSRGNPEFYFRPIMT